MVSSNIYEHLRQDLTSNFTETDHPLAAAAVEAAHGLLAAAHG